MRHTGVLTKQFQQKYVGAFLDVRHPGFVEGEVRMLGRKFMLITWREFFCYPSQPPLRHMGKKQKIFLPFDL